MEWSPLGASSDSVQADQTSNILDEATAFSIGSALAPSGQPALERLALAERIVRWEDDISRAELRLYKRLYAEALHAARLELGEIPERSFKPVSSPAGESLIDDRTELLRLRVEACALVSLAECSRRVARPRRPARCLRYMLVGLGLALIGALALRDSLAELFDYGNISRGRPWVASSKYADNIASSGVFDRFTGPFFFHTTYENNPWIEVDLGEESHPRSVTVINRQDCCANRAVPMVVETSSDHQRWRVAATRRASFSRWHAMLNVSSTRWVRLRVSRETHFHLRALIIRK
jgi:hypothetical protein